MIKSSNYTLQIYTSNILKFFLEQIEVDLICAVLCFVTQLCPTLCNPMDFNLPGSSVHGDSPGKSTGVGCHALLQGIFPAHRWNPGLSNCLHILYHLSHQGSPWILERVAYPFSRGSFRPRNQIRVSCMQVISLLAELPRKPRFNIFLVYSPPKVVNCYITAFWYSVWYSLMYGYR